MTLSEINDIVKSADGTHWHLDVEVDGKACGISYSYLMNNAFDGCYGCYFVIWLKNQDGIIKIDNIYDFIRCFNRVVAETSVNPSAADELLIIKERLKYSQLVDRLTDICCPSNEED